MSLGNFISELNENIAKPFVNIPGATFYGLTELITQKRKDASTYVMPGAISKTGEIKFVGYDDKSPLIIYHRLSTAQVIERVGSSYGDDRTDLITTYILSTFVYADRKMVCADQSELCELIQTALPDNLLIQGYKSVLIRVGSINFNTQQILKAEYQGSDAKLRPERVLIQINYQIESTLRKKCAVRCA